MCGDPVNLLDLNGEGFCPAGHNPKQPGEKHGSCRGGRVKDVVINVAAGTATATFVAACIATVACGVAAGAVGVSAIGVGAMGLHNAVATDAERRDPGNQARWAAGTIRAQVQGAACGVTIKGGCLRFITSPKRSWKSLRTWIP